MNAPDATLWADFLAGDERACDQLFLRYYDILYRYGLRLTGEEEVTKDSIQNVFQQLWQRRAALGPVAVVGPYLLTALRRQLARDQQAQRRQDELASTYEMEFEVQYTPEDFDLPESQYQQLLAALAQLSDRQREAVYLKFFDGLSYEQIAEVMALNVQSVRNLVHQGLKAMRQRVGLPLWLLVSKLTLSKLLLLLHR
ncbi:MAG: sigma-70 family RNA polymerase sigma factor [Hymenobacter sp.]|nr:MAG: sigma-70 family RNA polymerase sigma factor [Hymenobacter sp.]